MNLRENLNRIVVGVHAEYKYVRTTKRRNRYKLIRQNRMKLPPQDRQVLMARDKVKMHEIAIQCKDIAEVATKSPER